jgi:hypothetical protein
LVRELAGVAEGEMVSAWRRWAVTAIASALLLAACGSSVTNLPTHVDPLDPAIALVRPLTTLTGPLLDERGCLYIGSSDPTAREVPIWPAGYSFDQGAILAPGGRQVVVVGQTVTLAGGFYASADYGAVSKYVVGEVPAWCRQGQYWFVSAVVSFGTS